ncbi:putative mitochondrial F1F0 ATP synthase subunit Atp18 [Talaromyces proteolyticus]|uniref:Mitochondrial F1F0 ATP synthase subunit Atp18 n=1 Tax=Talaromyces proteolyticus TaxID=1131652 RepID=A0AAD4PTA4_9EURO|nr:putative mitochondrial F1F0 ATP synthase subunit Atp18 [Talaromyces proteolyticus]KAH8692985.1 putative mitochondrial F1F0 ATP synthase subunit Atp18 [Talaromyces proteolyticus]
MSLLGKKWPVPVGKTVWPFYAAGVVILYGVNAAANASMNSAEFKNDPRNPHAKPAKKDH